MRTIGCKVGTHALTQVLQSAANWPAHLKYAHQQYIHEINHAAFARQYCRKRGCIAPKCRNYSCGASYGSRRFAAI